MKTFVTDKVIHQVSLLKELKEETIVPDFVYLDLENNTNIIVEDEVDLDVVSTIVDAHDPSIGEAEDANALDLLNTTRSELVDQYQSGVTRLNAIITNGPTYTNVQIRDAVVDMAKIHLRMLKLMKMEMT